MAEQNGEAAPQPRPAPGRRHSPRLARLGDGLAAWADAGARQGRGRELLRRCPYCVAVIDLRRCDVVASARAQRRAVNTGFDNLDSIAETGPGDTGRGASSGQRGGYEVIYDAHRAPDRRAGGSIMAEMLGSAQAGDQFLPVTQMAPPQKMPRRVCPACYRLLPPELDELNVRFLAVVGITGAGKTHYLAQSLTEAWKKGSLQRFGCDEFVPTDADRTAHVLHNDYYMPVARHGQLLDATNPEESPRQLTLTVSVEGQRFLLVTHDIAGEALADPDRRAQELTFLRHADAMIFLLDPTEIETVRTRLPRHLLGPDRGADQVFLLRQCLREIEESDRPEIPVRLVLAKADLIASYCNFVGMWTQRPAADWEHELGRISDDVRRMLTLFDEKEVMRLLDGRQRTLFHAVSALGAPPDEDGQLSGALPLRCSDPMGAALVGMVRTPARWS